jgi:serine/threonine protein kinase
LIAKIADFGLAKSAGASSTGGALAGTVANSAPETFNDDGNSDSDEGGGGGGEEAAKVDKAKADVYALAVVFNEVLTRKVPWANKTIPKIIKMVESGKRPATPAELMASSEAAPSPLVVQASEVVAKAWVQNPRDRLEAAMVAKMLEDIAAPHRLRLASTPQPPPTPPLAPLPNTAAHVGRGGRASSGAAAEPMVRKFEPSFVLF